jgi:hypothetical protein
MVVPLQILEQGHLEIGATIESCLLPELSDAPVEALAHALRLWIGRRRGVVFGAYEDAGSSNARSPLGIFAFVANRSVNGAPYSLDILVMVMGEASLRLRRKSTLLGSLTSRQMCMNTHRHAHQAKLRRRARELVTRDFQSTPTAGERRSHPVYCRFEQQ